MHSQEEVAYVTRFIIFVVSSMEGSDALLALVAVFRRSLGCSIAWCDSFSGLDCVVFSVTMCCHANLDQIDLRSCPFLFGYEFVVFS